MRVTGRKWIALGVLAVAAVVLLVAIGPFLDGESEEQARPERATGSARAKSANAVSESVGVNVHIALGGVYDKYDAWKPKLADLGVRYVRDALKADNALQHSRLNDLADSGVKANVQMGDPKNKFADGTLDQLISALRTKVRSAVVSVEGPNEWDTNAGTYPCDSDAPERGCWSTDLRAYQRELYDKVNADPALAGVTVVGPGFALGDRRAVGDLSQWLDYGNMHSYPNNRNPEWSLEPNGGNEFGMAAIVSGGKPVVATETGYHNAVQSSEGHAPVSERASGIYVPRLLLDYFDQESARGQTVKRSFLYELIDAGTSLTQSQNRFGLLRSDLSEKPAYRSLRNLLALLEDRGPAFDLHSLDYSLEGDTNDVRRLLLQKRDGTFWLALWREVDVWDEASGGDLQPSAQRVTVRLARPVARASAYRPGESVTAFESWRDTSALQLSVSADVVLVRLATK